jgi:type II restriction/modification system DNA methylase subunit YeeA
MYWYWYIISNAKLRNTKMIIDDVLTFYVIIHNSRTLRAS